MGGWGGVFDAPAAPNRGVEDSAPATRRQRYLALPANISVIT